MTGKKQDKKPKRRDASVTLKPIRATTKKGTD